MKLCGVLNLATLLPNLPISREPLHNCSSLVSVADKPHNDLWDTPLHNSDLILFTDGSSFIRDGVLHTGPVVVELDTL